MLNPHFFVIFYFTDDTGKVIDKAEPVNLPFVPRPGEFIFIKNILTKRDYFGLKKNEFLERNKDKYMQDGQEQPLKVEKVIYSKKNSFSEDNNDEWFAEIHLCCKNE
ncbi:MAG: hypothetical protein CMO01_30350 [Thalassobius sp.]|nr:hypothetical protein [Thalassovita sp.]|tara:strand:+ start:96 stop:416 length:321 start_codon:yes stop_codon:yes gene_type:complete